MSKKMPNMDLLNIENNFERHITHSKEKVDEKIIETISDSDTDGYILVSIDNDGESNDINFIPYADDISIILALYVHFRNCFYKMVAEYVDKEYLDYADGMVEKFKKNLFGGD